MIKYLQRAINWRLANEMFVLGWNHDGYEVDPITHENVGADILHKKLDRKIPPFKVGYECQNYLQLTSFGL